MSRKNRRVLFYLVWFVCTALSRLILHDILAISLGAIVAVWVNTGISRIFEDFHPE